MSLSQTLVSRLYCSVIEDVISGIRDTFLDDGVDEQVLQELKQLWEAKLLASKAIEPIPEHSDQQPPPIVANNIKSNGVKSENSNANAANATAPAQTTNTINQTMLTNIAALDPNNKVPVQLTLPAQAGVPGSQTRIFTLQIPASALQNNQLHQVLTGPIITATMTLPHHLAATLLQQHINAALSGQQPPLAHITTPTTQPKSQLDGTDDRSDENMDWSMKVMRQPKTFSLLRKNENEPCAGCSTSTTEMDSLLEKRLKKIKSQRKKSNKRPMVIKFLVDGADDTSDEDMSDTGGAGASDDDIDGASGLGSDDANEDEDGEGADDGGAEEEPLNSGDDVSEEDPSDMFDTDNVVVCQYDKISRSRNKWKFYLKDGIMNLSGKDFVFQKANGDAEW